MAGLGREKLIYFVVLGQNEQLLLSTKTDENHEIKFMIDTGKNINQNSTSCITTTTIPLNNNT